MRKLEVLNTNYEKSGLYAKIPALNDMTLKEFFEGLNIVKNYDSVRTFNQAIETIDESILIDSSISLISGHNYFSAFDLIFKTMPADAPDSYRLWVSSEGVTDTITHSFLTNEKEVFMNVKTSASTRTADLYLNLFGLTIGQSMSLKTDLYFIIDLTNLSFEVTDEQVYYYYRMYRYLKDSKSFDGFTYLPTGQSKYDVAYVNKTIDDPIAELNGHTLREVFEDGNDIVDGNFELDTPNLWTTYLSPTSDYGIRTKVNDTYEVIKGSQPGIIFGQKINFEANKTYYGRFEFKVNDVALINGNASIYVDNVYGSINVKSSLVNNQFFSISFLRNDHTEQLDKRVDIILYNVIDGVKLTVKPTYVYMELNSLGLQNVTKEQMDYYYSLYQARKNITKKLTYADIFETGNLVANGDFRLDSNGDGLADNWSKSTGVVASLLNDVQIFLADSQFDNVTQTIPYVQNEQYYIIARIKSDSSSTRLYTELSTSFLIVNHSGSGNFEILKSYYTPTTTSGNGLIRVQDSRSSGWTNIEIDYIYNIPMSLFSPAPTQTQLDTMLAHYLLVKNIVIYPEIYVPIEPVGLGNRFKLLAVYDVVYGHELDFEDISFKMYFGINFDAYKGYHAMMNMLKSNKAIIEYDWGIGPRYNDVRLLNAPKTEKDTSLLIISKFYFKRLNPFYELIEVSDEEDMKNESDLDSPVKLDLTVSNTTVSIKLLDASSGVQQEISFDFAGVSTPFNLTIDPETKKLLIDDITDAYDYADHTKDSFIYLPGDSEIYSINITGAAVNKITYKKWVIS